MDWGTGTKAQDDSSNLNHGTLTNGPEWIEFIPGTKDFTHYKLNGNTIPMEIQSVNPLALNFQKIDMVTQKYGKIYW